MPRAACRVARAAWRVRRALPLRTRRRRRVHVEQKSLQALQVLRPRLLLEPQRGAHLQHVALEVEGPLLGLLVGRQGARPE